MDRFYSISIHNQYASILVIKKQRKDIYQIIEEDTIDISKLPKYTKNKKRLCVALDVDETLDDIVTLPSSIKTRSLLKAYLKKRFKDIIGDEDIILNYHIISKNKEKSTITYKVDAIYKKDFLEKTSFIKSHRQIKSITIDKFALFSLAKKCFSNKEKKGYLIVHTYGNDITILAVNENNDLIFERKSSTSLEQKEFRYLNLSEEIIQTVSYIKQQFRNIQFKTLLLGGSLVVDDRAAEHLMFSTDLSVASLYPNTFLTGLTTNEPHFHIISLGAFLVQKKEMFLSEEIYSKKEFDLISNSILFLSFVMFFISSYMFYTNYDQYDQTLQRYEIIKTRLLKTIKSIETFPMEKLQKYYEFIKMKEKYCKTHPMDYFIVFKPLIDILSPTDFIFENGSDAKFKIKFSKKFSTLKQLYNFEKEFIKNFKAINTKKSFLYVDKTDYGKLKFSVEISTNKKKRTPIKHRRRRR